jgi:CheY-like chemotaxis protein/predicted  nucleic acid-binding Zn-ribbon protein
LNAPPPNAPACSVEELQKLCNTLALQHAEVQRERDEFARQIAAMPRSSVEAEKALLSIRQARDTLLTRNHELLGQLTVAENQHAELQNQFDDLTHAHDAAKAELQALRQEVAELQQSRAPAPAAAPEPDKGLVTAMAEMGRQLASVTEERDDALTRAAELEARCAQSDAATAERLAAVEKERDAAIESSAALQRKLDQLLAERAAAPAPKKSAVRKDPGLEALHERFASLQKEPAPGESLEHFGKQLLALSLRGQSAGLVATHRLAGLAAEYVAWLQKVPAKIPNALGSLGETLEVIDWLCALKTAERHPDPTGALVYSVDDDVDNCECITMAFEKLAFQTRYAIKPETALADFSSARCDLILLDVDMPGMSGIELQSRIREIPHLRTTPIIFVSGHLSAAERVTALGPELHRFVAKPYSLNELSLRALTLVIQSRLAA